jgi:hypothetical protein
MFVEKGFFTCFYCKNESEIFVVKSNNFSKQFNWKMQLHCKHFSLTVSSLCWIIVWTIIGIKTNLTVSQLNLASCKFYFYSTLILLLTLNLLVTNSSKEQLHLTFHCKCTFEMQEATRIPWTLCRLFFLPELPLPEFTPLLKEPSPGVSATGL